ncbi:MAG: ketopantoate reductase family protein [Myxococcota bacterium]
MSRGTPSVTMIGAGRVGLALSTRAQKAGVPCNLVTRITGWEALSGAAGVPILVTTRNDDLDAVVAQVPEERRSDLVFVQNGMLQPWLVSRGLGECSRGLLYFAVPTRHAPVSPGGASLFTGARADQLVQWFGAVALDAQALERHAFAEAELEKLIWNAAFGLLCQRFDLPVGAVVEHKAACLRDLVAEMAQVGRAALGVDLALDPLLARLCRYSMTIPGYLGAVRDWPWRNGWVEGEAVRTGIATPLHRELLHGSGYILKK